MGRLAWNPEWDTGFPNIDEQHQRLLTEFNDFLDAIQNHIHQEHVTNLLEFLVDFLDTHFEEEEIQMRVTHYPRLLEHKAFHDSMRSKAQSLKESFREDPETVATDVVDLVTNWVENHISFEDKLLAKHLLQFSRKLTDTEC